MRNGIVAATLAMLMVLALMPVAMAASDEDSMDAEITVTSEAPEIDNVWVSSETWTVWSYENVTVQVTDNNTLADISWIQITVYDNGKAYGDADATRDHYTFKFTAPSTWEEIGPDSGSDSHINASACVAATTSNTTDNYIFNIRVDNSAQADNQWNIQVEVHNGTNLDNEAHNNQFTVNQYIAQTLGQASVAWASVSAGATDEVCDTFPATTTITSNDDWKLQLKLENANWISGANNFAGSNTKFDSDSDVGGATQFSDSYQDLYTGQTYTADSGDSKNVYFWTSVPGGQAPGDYHNAIWSKVLHE